MQINEVHDNDSDNNDGDEVINQIINEIPTFGEAIRFTVRKSGLTDKQVYLEIGIDGSHWSRIINGLASLPVEKYKPLKTVCNNDFFIRWFAKDLGYDVSLSKEVLEDSLRKCEEEKDELKRKLENIVETLKAANIEAA